LTEEDAVAAAGLLIRRALARIRIADAAAA
jgi:hypothetical protein